MVAPVKNVDKKEQRSSEQIERTRSTIVYTPKVDIIERKDDILLIADMPGVDESGVDITLEKDVLTIYGKVDTEMPEGLRLISAEYGIGDYQRSFTISSEVDREKIKATLNNGVLTLLLPKAEPAKTKKIKVEAVK
ncbi:MAG: Hsp20/alpha crystallin family protein [Syntrophorhabdaceae bacterium]|nr:Hsp20/alpha crystallin family protein [Syntrophorhabdaceae bacterium]